MIGLKVPGTSSHVRLDAMAIYNGGTAKFLQDEEAYLGAQVKNLFDDRKLKVSAGDYLDMTEEVGKDEALGAILHSITHIKGGVLMSFFPFKQKRGII